jgi:hypothetical protein
MIMKTETGANQGDETSQIPDSSICKSHDVRRSGREGSESANPWYELPDYGRIDELSEDRIAVRMNYLKFQIGVLEEAAEFELNNADRHGVLEAISACRTERDALGERLCQRIVDGDLETAKECSRLYKRSNLRMVSQSLARQYEIRKANRSSHPRKSVHGAGGRTALPTLAWNGVERRHTLPIAINVPRTNSSIQKGRRRSQVIQILLQY